MLLSGSEMILGLYELACDVARDGGTYGHLVSMIQSVVKKHQTDVSGTMLISTE